MPLRLKWLERGNVESFMDVHANAMLAAVQCDMCIW